MLAQPAPPVSQETRKVVSLGLGRIHGFYLKLISLEDPSLLTYKGNVTILDYFNIFIVLII